jgi:hypothetical protein
MSNGREVHNSDVTMNMSTVEFISTKCKDAPPYRTSYLRGIQTGKVKIKIMKKY